MPTSIKAFALKLLGALLFLSAIAMWLSHAPDWPVEALVARWAPPPSQFIDLVTIVTLVAMLVLLADRIMNPVKRFLSTFEDWFTWTLTFLPVLTGWLAVRHLLLPYTTMLALHILCVELLLVFLPFTKLFHAFTVFGSRWFIGAINGHKGVAV